MAACALDVVLYPPLLGFREAVVEEEGSCAEISHFLWGDSYLFALLPFAINIVSGLDRFCVLLYELKEDRDVVDLEVALEHRLLGKEGLLLFLRPLLQQKLALVPDLHIAKLVLNIALDPSHPYCRLDGLASG